MWTQVRFAGRWFGKQVRRFFSLMAGEKSPPPMPPSLFVNRTQELVRLGNRVFGSATEIVFVHGSQGVGKTTLLRYFDHSVCSRVSRNRWEQLKSHAGTEFHDRLAEKTNVNPVRTVFYDFGGPRVDGDTPTEAVFGLRRIRYQLGHECPRFDFALVWFWHQTGLLTRDKLESFFPGATWSAAKILSNLVLVGGWTGVPELIDLWCQKTAVEWSVEKHAFDLVSAEIYTMVSQQNMNDVLKMLPELLASDINMYRSRSFEVQRNTPLVLMFDHHESFWPDLQLPDSAAYPVRDEWFRRFLSSLDHSANIAVIVNGNKSPVWSTAAYFPLGADRISLLPVGDLHKDSAFQYLSKRGLVAPEILQRLLQFGSSGESLVYPLFMSIYADACVESAEQSDALESAHETSFKKLVYHLLETLDRDAEYALIGMASAEAFTYEDYATVCDALKIAQTQSGFDRLTHLSFVSADTTQAGRFIIHPVVRRALVSGNSETIRTSSEALLNALVKKIDAGQAISLVDLLTYQNVLNPDLALAEWLTAVDAALEIGDVRLAFALIHSPLREQSGRANAPALFAMNEARYLQLTGHPHEAFHLFGEAIVMFEQLKEEDWWKATKMSLCHRYRGSIKSQLSEYQVAESEFRLAREYATSALAKGAEPIYNSNLALILLDEADANRAMAKVQESEALYRQAIEFLLIAKSKGADIALASLNLVAAYTSMAELLAPAGRREEALEWLSRAAELLNRDSNPEEFGWKPGFAMARLTKLRASIWMDTSEAAKAEKALSESVSLISQLIEGSPGRIELLELRAKVNAELARLHFENSRIQNAIDASRCVFDDCEAILRIVPIHQGALDCQAAMLSLLAYVDTDNASFKTSAERIERLITTLRQVRQMAPNNPALVQNMAVALGQKARALALSVENRPIEEFNAIQTKVRETFEECFALFAQNIEMTPSDPRSYSGYAVFMLWFSKIFAFVSPQESEHHARFAVKVHEEALVLNGNNADLLSMQSWCELVLGGLLIDWNLAESAGSVLQDGVKHADAALQVAPNLVDAILNRAELHLCLARIADNKSCKLKYARLSEKGCLKALKIAIGSQRAQDILAQARELL